jgi:phosphopantothenoylcysteine decarboxylase/phosphopantothenate--cysteine ligase
MHGKKIIVGVTGGIAAFKTPLLIRLLVTAGADVKVVATDAAFDFVTPLTLSTVAKNPVESEFFDEAGNWNSHVELGLWADAFVIAPATANTIGKMAHGLCDNLLLATYLSARCPVAVAPAMDLDMLQHPSVQKNIKTISEYGNHIIEPTEGELASGLEGKGRMAEPEEIFEFLVKLLNA